MFQSFFFSATLGEIIQFDEHMFFQVGGATTVRDMSPLS